MKKNNNFMIIGMLFMASIITELYFLLEFRENISLILGGGVIVLLTTYLLFSWFQECFVGNRNLKENGNSAEKIDKDMLEDILKFEKATYLTMHQIVDYEKNKNDEWEEELELFKEEIIEAENNAAKLVAKYHREDIMYIIKNLKESSSKIAVSIEKIAEKSIVQEITDGVTQSIHNLEQTVNQIEDLLKEGNFGSRIDSQSVNETKENIYGIDKELKDLDIEKLKDNKNEKENNKIINEEIEEDNILLNNVQDSVLEGIEKLGDNEDSTVESNKNEEETISLDAQFLNNEVEKEPIEKQETKKEEKQINTETNQETEKVPEEIKETNPNKQMSPEEIEQMIATMDSQKEDGQEPIEKQGIKKEEEQINKETNQETEKAPEEIKETNPNKQMSPEEIAQMIATMDSQKEDGQEPIEKQGIKKEEEQINKETNQETKKAPEEIKETNPNKQMSPEEIAQMIATMDSQKKEEKEPIEKQEAKIETEKTVDEKKQVAQKVQKEPKDADLNKQMSPEEIAALFASMK